ncbi:unnamed protein product [Arabidopsis lyrata]|uniref:F-box domain-containing protein n=1 Tax=Arabidopsis lyrata subsp. lyrata TaxID=81972 RepID=D7KXT4_ARALL|nr:hypothetical protein ARALYDRAFT_893603 [Arabidopsis lyrata subsp. lyrata]CAH8256457.1 unnamed protein product [Arabidopsis lyrata]
MEEKTGRRTQYSSTRSSHRTGPRNLGVKGRPSRDNDTSQSEHIPLDLTIQILSRLPAKSVGRFRSVSKLWSTITTSQYFINSFATRSLASGPSGLLTVQKGDILFVFSSPLHKNSPDGQFSCVGSYQFTKPNFGNLFDYYYVHAAEGEYYKGCILRYDQIDKKYIVLRVFVDSKICILTLGAQGQGSWRIITNGVPRHKPTLRYGGCINGVMYYGALVDVFKHRIMSFNVRSEKFNQIKYPEGSSHLCSYLISYEGRLALVDTLIFSSIDLWILMDGDRHKWTHKRFVLPFSEMKPKQKKKLHFKGVSNTGELTFATWGFSKSVYILYFDSRRNSIREVETVGDEFRLVEEYMYTMNVYPNNIESLGSL